MEATLSHSLLYVHIVPVLQGNQSIFEELGWQGDKNCQTARFSMQLAGVTWSCQASLSGRIAGDGCRIASGSSHIIGVNLHARISIRVPKRPRSCIQHLYRPPHVDM